MNSVTRKRNSTGIASGCSRFVDIQAPRHPLPHEVLAHIFDVTSNEANVECTNGLLTLNMTSARSGLSFEVVTGMLTICQNPHEGVPALARWLDVNAPVRRTAATIGAWDADLEAVSDADAGFRSVPGKPAVSSDCRAVVRGSSLGA
jgi:hypothetical protein